MLIPSARIRVRLSPLGRDFKAIKRNGPRPCGPSGRPRSRRRPGVAPLASMLAPLLSRSSSGRLPATFFGGSASCLPCSSASASSIRSAASVPPPLAATGLGRPCRSLRIGMAKAPLLAPRPAAAEDSGKATRQGKWEPRQGKMGKARFAGRRLRRPLASLERRADLPQMEGEPLPPSKPPPYP